MNKPLIWIVAMSTAASLPSVAVACDFDGTPGFGGMHRFNPFAKIMPPDPAPERRSTSSRSSSRDQADRSRDEERSRDRRSRGRQNEEDRPKREREGDYSNGPMSPTDKATNT